MDAKGPRLGFLWDSTWAGTTRTSWRLAAATFAILALEIALIRWGANQVRLLAYLGNVVLIASFLGMGIGLFLGRRWPGLVHLALPAMLLLAIPLAFSDHFGLLHLRFPDTSIYLWGGESEPESWLHFCRTLLVVMTLFAGVVAVFTLQGAAVGVLFRRLEPLRAYSADLVGSLLGTAAVTLAIALYTPPPVWFAVGATPLLLLSRRVSSLLSWGALIAVTWASTQGAIFSPYYRIDLSSQGDRVELRVNRDFFQDMLDLSDRHLQSLPRGEVATLRENQRRAYDLPFVMTAKRDRALILAAGTGNDVAAAIRCNWKSITAVDIDPLIVKLGGALHPERPYSDPRVTPVISDARAFLESYRGTPFDLVCFGLLDSHAVFTAMSSLRLDNYVYTEEGIRSAWKVVAPDGYLSLSFCTTGGAWITQRLFYTIRRATGLEPLMIFHNAYDGCTFLVPKPGVRLDLSQAASFPRLRIREPESQIRATSDDWPFLYVQPGRLASGYIAVVLGILISALFLTRWASKAGGEQRSFDPVMFFMGAAFMLLETRGITSFSLLFGSTWVVNLAVMGGVLIMALGANLVVERWRPRSIAPWFALLFASLCILWIVPVSSLNQFPIWQRGLMGGLLNASPILFAGVLFSTMLSRSPRGETALGSNLLGAVVGGCVEYLSMLTGLRFMLIPAGIFYLLAFYLAARAQRRRQLKDSVSPLPSAS